MQLLQQAAESVAAALLAEVAAGSALAMAALLLAEVAGTVAAAGMPLGCSVGESVSSVSVISVAAPAYRPGEILESNREIVF